MGKLQVIGEGKILSFPSYQLLAFLGQRRLEPLHQSRAIMAQEVQEFSLGRIACQVFLTLTRRTEDIYIPKSIGLCLRRDSCLKAEGHIPQKSQPPLPSGSLMGFKLECPLQPELWARKRWEEKHGCHFPRLAPWLVSDCVL